ncbi:hypothetical protein [Gordonia alkanivorans]|uniref:hypothetical protein n=1 Tax=Gordonia alkanivorans TaxID=84096 RepID=UPI0004B360F2|nr:hypothetical protein [Gordonia alkanivorans]
MPSPAYCKKLLDEARHLREVNSRLAEGLLRTDLDNDTRAQIVEQIDRYQRGAEQYEQQVNWYRHLSGQPVAVVPSGPAWRD